MTSYTSEIVAGSAIVAAAAALGVGIGAYIGKTMEEKSGMVVGSAIVAAAAIGVAAYIVTRPTTMHQPASALHTKAWGKPWPQSEDTISKTEISGESGLVDDDYDVDDALAEKLEVPPHFNYQYFKEIRSLKRALGASSVHDFEDILVVRDEYKILRQALEEYQKYFRAFVVTGHPGIGKTTFLFYLLLYRLERKLPTAVQLDDEYYFIFDEQGAAVHRVAFQDPRLAKCWALTDSNDNIHQPCSAFQSLAELVILASPPKPKRWKEWIKQAEGYCIISDLPSVPEIAAIAKELRKRQIQLKKQLLYDPSSTLSLVRKWGPSTRNIIRSMKLAAHGRVDPIEREANGAAARICNNPSTVCEASLDIMPQSDVSSVIFLRRTRNVSVWLDESQHFIPTPHLLALFEEQRREMANKQSLRLVCALSSHALTKTSAGWAHEKLTHERLGTGGEPLSISQGTMQKTMEPSTRLLPGTLAGLKDAGANDSFYWIPSVANFPGVDGVLGDTDGHVYTIQATIGDKHTSPTEGIKKIWKHFLPEVQTGRTWHFVFIVDEKQTANKYAEEFPKEFKLGHANVQVWVCALRAY